MTTHTELIARLEPFVQGLGKAIAREVADALEAQGREVARLREVNAEQYGALDLAARECTTLRAELAAIRARAGDGKEVADKLKSLMIDAGGALTGEMSVTSEAWRKACTYIDHICIGLDSPPRPASLSWEQAEKVCDMPLVEEAIRNLLSDQTGDNATAMIQVIVEAVHSAEGSAA